MSTFKDYLAYFENNQEWLDKCVDMILQHGFMLDTYNERYFKQEFIYDLEQSYGLGNLSACGKLFKTMLPKIKKLAMDKVIGGEEKAIQYCITAIERKQKQTDGFGYDFFNCFGIPWAAKMYFEKRMGTPDDMSTPPGSIGYLIGSIASALESAYRFRVKSQDYVRRIAELFVNSEEGTKYLEDLASRCTKEINESKTVKLNESDLRKMVTECVKRVLNEGFASRKLANAFKQYGGFYRGGGSSRFDVGFSQITDNDVIAIVDNENRTPQDRFFSANGESDKRYVKQLGYDIGPGDKVISIPFGDNRHFAVVISRGNANGISDQEVLRNRRENMKRNDGAEQYQSVNGASQIMNSFKNSGQQGNPIYRQNTVGNYLNYRKGL